MAVHSTAGTVSRISLLFSTGAGVVTPRPHTHDIVTEYGVANLRARSLNERARALIDIAAPQFREQLVRQANEDWVLRL